MQNNKYDIVICGAGIAGISSAYFLSVNHGVRNILIIDERPPLSLTSDKSTECYRNWWPGPDNAMVQLMNRSIYLLEELADETNNLFHLNRRGYLYVTGDDTRIDEFLKFARGPSHFGAGPLRIFRNKLDDPVYVEADPDDYGNSPEGADLFLDTDLILKYFPYLSEEVKAALHVRRAGWFSAQQLGMYLLKQARTNGVNIIQSRIVDIESNHDRISSVKLGNGDVIQTRIFINAAGPFLKTVGNMFGVDIPVYCELHQKAAFRDYNGVIPRETPLMIWTDPQIIDWSTEEQALLSEDIETRWLLDELPAGAHTRPEGGHDSQIVLMLWEYKTERVDTKWPPDLDPAYPEIALRGLIRLLPSLGVYINKLPRFTLDGGYYTKTIENRPLICPLPISGSYVIGALSGFGLMAACAAGELLAAHITSSELPEYTRAFHIDRYTDPGYLSKLENWEENGQL